MKKLLLLLLIPCLLLCSCNIAGSGNGQTNEQTTTEETTEEVTTEETIELNFPTLRKLEEYEYLLRNVSLPEYFISFDRLPEMGDFVSFTVVDRDPAVEDYYDFDYMQYYYRFEYTIYDDGSNDDGFKLEIIHKQTLLLDGEPMQPSQNSNLQYYFGEDTGTGFISIGDIHYVYSGGILQDVFWQIDDVTFWLRSAPNAENGFKRFDLEKTKFDFIRDLLNAETAPAAIERFAAGLRGEGGYGE